MKPVAYDRFTQALHWSAALVVICVYAIAVSREFVPKPTVGKHQASRLEAVAPHAQHHLAEILQLGADHNLHAIRGTRDGAGHGGGREEGVGSGGNLRLSRRVR